MIWVLDLERLLEQAQEQLPVAELPAPKVQPSLVYSSRPASCCYYIMRLTGQNMIGNAESFDPMQL